MKKVKDSLGLLKRNWKTLMGFEIFYKLITFAVFAPLFGAAFNGIMKLTGYAYLTLENVYLFLRNPITITMLLFLLLFMTVYSMIDTGGVIFILDQSAQQKEVSILETMKFTFKNALRVFKRQNYLMIFVILFMIPFLNLGVASSFVNTISIPEFILKYIRSYWYLRGILILLVAGLAFLLLRWMYAFHYFTLEGCEFKEARQYSSVLSRTHLFSDLIALLCIQAVCSLMYMTLLAAATFLVVQLGKLLTKIFLFKLVMSTAVWVLLGVTFATSIAFAMPISYACISALYYEHKEARGEKVVHSRIPSYHINEKDQKRLKILKKIVLAGAILTCLILGFMGATGRLNPQVEYLRTMEVTAHRGASADYPENTMAAFAGAVEQGADWIELDVQQSKDGQIFVMHDSNFRRIAGVNKYSWELTYEEIARLDAGSHFGEEFAGEKIPLLSEVLTFAKDHFIRLNIELKPTGHETDFEKMVVDLIEEYDFEDSCVVTSMSYHVLENVKAYNPDVTTVYVMGFAYGNVNALEAADHFSIESDCVTSSLVKRVHNAGKQLYAWTANTKRNIEKMIDLNVDNIITDNVALAQKCVYESKTSDLMRIYIRFLLE